MKNQPSMACYRIMRRQSAKLSGNSPPLLRLGIVFHLMNGGAGSSGVQVSFCDLVYQRLEFAGVLLGGDRREFLTSLG
jgi:hypothetical protein